MRRKKVNPSDKGVRVDFRDDNGDSWQEYPVLHPKFKDWCELEFLKEYPAFGGEYPNFENYFTKEKIQQYFENSPWYKACANDISWEKRVDIQAVIQKYTTNAISSTMNLPNDVTKETVAGIYMKAWEKGLKGITIYRDGCRTGVLVAETKVQTNEFGYSDSVKRPKELEAQLHVVSVKGKKYGVVVGVMNKNPYEVFAFSAPEEVTPCKGIVKKVKKGHYDFISEDGRLRNLQSAALHPEEQVLTRLVSGMLRHGMNPYFIIDQINKTPLEVVSFGKALTRVLKQYIKEDELKGKVKCNDCGSENVRLQEGCLTCNDCGSSKCS